MLSWVRGEDVKQVSKCNAARFHSLCAAMKDVTGDVKVCTLARFSTQQHHQSLFRRIHSRNLIVLQPYSITGSLPLVQDMKENGFDIQVGNYGCYPHTPFFCSFLFFFCWASERGYLFSTTSIQRQRAHFPFVRTRSLGLGYRKYITESTSIAYSGLVLDA